MILTVPHYNVDFIERSHNILISGKTTSSSEEQEEIVLAINESSRQLSYRIVQLWERLNIRHVIVENGTLPENIIFTKALYLAIDVYGKRHGLGNFVIWRDHDLMWNSEMTAMKYGSAPYPHAVKPAESKHITYVTLNNRLKNKLEAWCHHEVEIKVKRNTYDFTRQGNYTNIRDKLSIRDNDVLIARTTRIIPQKRIDRDIHLVNRLNQLFLQNGIDRKAFLVVAGDSHEDHVHYQELKALGKKLNIGPFIKFIGLLQHEDTCSPEHKNSIEDLYYSCDLVSFLTSWDYDSYGNPIGEAISFKRCYITTSYEYYSEGYGQYGFEAPVMAISEKRDGLPDEAFVNGLYEFLNNKQLMNDVAWKNVGIGSKVLSNSIIDILEP
ncbi:hypothetical protein [Sinorhizobium psoraleae]|uniref:hypothetical protein n=1 Tax=Sinorhizobium psoraleae TaxID=520838 RepID=UPI001AEDDDAB|nr:hypothetical protein [Sinorhizobium psoraleae]